MKIIWITSLFPSGTDTTKGIYLYRTVKKLSESMDITTLVVYPSIPPIIKMIENPRDAIKTYKYWRKNFPKNPQPPQGIKSSNIYYLRYLRLPRRFFNHFEGYFAYLKTKRILSKIITKDSILHANWIFPSGQLAYLISRKYKVPFIVSLLGTDVHNLKYGTKYWVNANTIITNASKITSVSKQLVEKCRSEKIEIGNDKVKYIDNIYDENEFRILSRENIKTKLLLDNSSKIILFAGGLVPVKNVETLVSAFAGILKTKPNLILLLAGAGTNKGMLENLSQKLYCENKVKFLGNLSSNSLIEYFNAADIFCLPSKNEGTPNVIIESLLCGTPVVASNVGGIPNVIHEDINGFMFNPANVEELKVSLDKALNKDWNRENLRNSVSKFFTSETIFKYSDLYNKISVQKYD